MFAPRGTGDFEKAVALQHPKRSSHDVELGLSVVKVS